MSLLGNRRCNGRIGSLIVVAVVLGLGWSTAIAQSREGDAPQVTVAPAAESSAETGAAPEGAPPPPPADTAGPPVVAQRPGWSGPAPAAGEIAPSFVTMDRMDANSRFGVQIGFEKVDRVSIDDAFYMRANLYGQYVLPQGNVGLYGQLPISHGFVSDSVGLGGSNTAIGNLDGGVYFMPRRNNEIILRAGVVLPTASDDSTGLITNVLTSYERMTDLLLADPKTWVLRLSASTLQQRDALFFRGDLGLDLIVSSDSTSDHNLYGRLNLAAGIRAQVVDLALELVNYGVLDGSNPGGDITDRFFHTGTIALRSRGEHQLHAAFVLPLDSSLRGELWIVSVGYQHAL